MHFRWLIIVSGKRKSCLDASDRPTYRFPVWRSFRKWLNRICQRPGVLEHSRNLSKEGLACVAEKVYTQIKRLQRASNLTPKLKNRWYLDPPHVTLFGQPSAQFAEQLAQEERDRIERQRKELGEEKLKEKQLILEKAMKANDVELPKDILENFTIPPVSSINFINVLTARNIDTGEMWVFLYMRLVYRDLVSLLSCSKNEIQEYVNNDRIGNIPLFIQYDRTWRYTLYSQNVRRSLIFLS